MYFLIYQKFRLLLHLFFLVPFIGTCGKGAELNDGDISWDGKTFRKKPVDAVTLAMWVKVHKGGTINWFASGDQGTTFFTSTKDATIPAKVWTHVTGSYDSATGT